MLIGELFLGAFLQVLFDRIASKPVLDFFQCDGLEKSHLSYLETILFMLEPVLDSTEEKQFTNGRVKEWLHRLKATLFDANDLLNQIAMKNLPSSMEPEPESPSWVPMSNTHLGFDNKAPLSTASQTRSTLEKVTGEPCNLHSLETMQVELSAKLGEKSFLVVLDDVWSERVEDWELLCCPFNARAQGSRIIITTRNEGVADIMGGFPKVRLHKLLKEDD
ncbi:hypothetical protein Ancab_022114 [Ancistrocladus abbreviatus]